MPFKDQDFKKQEPFNESQENVRKIFVERDIFGLEKQKPGPIQSGIAPYKLLIGVLLVFLVIFIVYVVTNLI